MVYQLAIAQTLSLTLGDAVLRYNITIGLFIFSLGLGSLCHHFIKNFSAIRTFSILEILLGIIGGFSTLLIFLSQSIFPQQIVSLFSHGIICLIGVLSGLELPLLFRFPQAKNGGQHQIKTLSFDFYGMVLASLIFPFIFLPKLGIFCSTLIAGLVNILGVLFIGLTFSKSLKRFLHFAWLSGALITATLIYFWISNIEGIIWEWGLKQN